MKTFRFDFGSAPVHDNYIKIGENSIFNENTGYGIARPAKSVTRSAGKNPLCRDFTLMKENEFTVKLPAGKYNVRVYSGDYSDDGDVNVKLTINGRHFRMWVPDRHIFIGEYRIDSQKDRLNFQFDGRYVCINAIEIMPLHEETVKSLKASVHAQESHSNVTLTFDTLDFATGYKIYRKQPGDHEYTFLAQTRENRFEDDNVDLCAAYSYLVNALDELSFQTADGQELEVSVVDGGKKPEMPKKLEAHSAENSISLHFEPVASALYYNIYQKPPYGLYKKVGAVKVRGAKECDFLDTGVNTSVPYTYAVEAVTASGLSPKATVTTSRAAPSLRRHMERLDRGLIAMKTADGVFLSWRLNAYEYKKGINFLLYRNGKQITDKPVADSTNYLDREGKAGDSYTVRAVRGGITEPDGYTAKVIDAGYLSIPLDKPEPYRTPDGVLHEYIANDASVADLDGDGEYEIILKWDAGSKDNSQKGYTGLVYLDAYKLSGKKLWRINLGVNIRAGAHYTQFLAYDFDSDGKAELIIKTADGTTDAAGNVIGDKKADYRNKDGFIIEGPEYLTVFDGETGRALDTVDYDPPRGTVSDWGDSWGNRVDRFLACVAYLDGVHPSAVMCRGYYDRGRPTVLAAYDLIGKKLKKRWKFLADKNHNIDFTNQGNHNLGVGDIDGDGYDEIVYGACAIDHDGTGIYSTGLGHGDAMHLGKFDPKTGGLDFFQIHEDSTAKYGFEVRNPATGEIRWGVNTGCDTGRGLVADIDPRYEGCEVWAKNSALYTFDGKLIAKDAPKAINFAIWWDGDLERELLDMKWQGGNPETSGIGQIYKWDYKNNRLKTILDTKDSYSNNWTKGNPCLQADIFGDWREEVIWRDEKSTELRIYTTTDLTNHKFYTLMHDPVYRLGVVWQNVAYNQPPQTSFYIGEGMQDPPVPNNEYIGLNSSK